MRDNADIALDSNRRIIRELPYERECYYSKDNANCGAQLSLPLPRRRQASELRAAAQASSVLPMNLATSHIPRGRCSRLSRERATISSQSTWRTASFGILRRRWKTPHRLYPG